MPASVRRAGTTSPSEALEPECWCQGGLPGAAEVLAPVGPRVGAGIAELIVGGDAQAVELGTKVVGALVNRGLNDAALNLQLRGSELSGQLRQANSGEVADLVGAPGETRGR